MASFVEAGVEVKVKLPLYHIHKKFRGVFNFMFFTDDKRSTKLFPLNKLQSTKLITLQETITHLMNYQHCALHASRAYMLKDNRRYTIFLNNARCACLGT